MMNVLQNVLQVEPSRTKRQHDDDDAIWIAAGFEYRWLRGAARLHYAWQEDFPVFEVTPGIVGTEEGLVARHEPADIEILFPYGTPALDIKDRLDSEIYEIIAHDAEIDDEPIDWPAAGEEIDIDDFMTGRWVRS